MNEPSKLETPRPKRAKTGGRQKGSRNKATASRERAVAATGETPLDYVLRVMRNPHASPSRRDWAAATAAPYVHPKLASVTHAGGDKPIEHEHRVTFHVVDAKPLPEPFKGKRKA